MGVRHNKAGLVQSNSEIQPGKCWTFFDQVPKFFDQIPKSWKNSPLLLALLSGSWSSDASFLFQ